jgi:hypothetical protein
MILYPVLLASDSASEHGPNSEEEDPALPAVFFICFSLLAGSALRALSKRIQLPYTVLLMIFGIVWGALVLKADPREEVLGIFSSSVRSVA